MKNVLSLILLLLVLSCSKSIYQHFDEKSVVTFQQELNAEYHNPKESPLRGENFQKFKEHPFFTVNHHYSTMAKLVKTENAQPFELPTSSGKNERKGKPVIPGEPLPWSF